MDKQYRNVCSNMLEYYSKYFTEKEISALKKIINLNQFDNLNIILFVNKLIDRIWQMTLTKPNQFRNGKSFTFLVTRDVIPTSLNIEDIKKIKTNKNHFLSLITNESIINSCNGINGVIVEIDYLNCFSSPLLPVDFETKDRILANAKLEPTGIYHISLNLQQYDESEYESDYYAQQTSLPKININKPLYNFQINNVILDKNDIEDLCNQLIIYYLVTNDYPIKNIVKIRDMLKETYKQAFFLKYIEYFNHQITLEEYVEFMFSLLEHDLSLLNNSDVNKQKNVPI